MHKKGDIVYVINDHNFVIKCKVQGSTAPSKTYKGDNYYRVEIWPVGRLNSNAVMGQWSSNFSKHYLYKGEYLWSKSYIFEHKNEAYQEAKRGLKSEFKMHKRKMEYANKRLTSLEKYMEESKL